MYFSIWEKEPKRISNFIYRFFNQLSDKKDLLNLAPVQAKGIWDGRNPNTHSKKISDHKGKIVIRTRAKVKMKFLSSFWKHVRPTNERLSKSNGREFSMGTGEWPFFSPNNIQYLERFRIGRGLCV